jgi:transcriptional regulator with XRE-family HTH domain
MNMPIGAAIRHVRKARGFTGARVAGKAGITPSQLSKIERGRAMPRFDTIVFLAIAMDLKPHKLVRMICEAGCLDNLHSSSSFED